MKRHLQWAWLIALLCTKPAFADPRPALLIDADTANEIDDCYAIARLIAQHQFRVVGVNSTQWWHYLSSGSLPPGETTVAASHRVNEELMEALGHPETPLFLGSNEPMGKPWGGFEAKDSEAARAVIAHAAQQSPDDKLNVVCLGATTNIASALAKRPEIAASLRVYLLGFRFDVEHRVWNKSSFNVRRDLNAADYLLNMQDLELHIMPANVTQELRFQKVDAFVKQGRLGALGEYLTSVWIEHCEHHDTRIMWDLALAEALLNPHLAQKISVNTPPENTQRDVTVYTAIQSEEMAADFWQALERFMRREQQPRPSPSVRPVTTARSR